MISPTKVLILKRTILLSIVLLVACQPPAAVPSSTAGIIPDRSGPPQLGDPKELVLPEIQSFMLSNGIPVYLMEKHNVPIIQIVLQVKAGDLNDPDDMVGLASFTASMLDEGVEEMDALALADALDFLGANLSTGSQRYASTVSLNVPAAKLGEAMPILADVVLRPSFPAEDLNRLKARSLTSLLQERDSPNAIARVASGKVLFGNHPFGRRTEESDIKSTGVQDLMDFHSKHYVANNASFIVAGDIDIPSLKSHLEPHFQNWEKGSSSTINVPELSQVEDRQLYLIDKPGAAQSVIILGRIGVSRYSEDFYPITVMNTVLGGSFTSRLNYNLREKHGYAYGAGSWFSMGKDKGPFGASASVQTDATDKSLVEFMNELRAISEGISSEEINRAKNYVALGYPGRFETVGDYANQVASLVRLDLPFNTFNEYTKRILEVTVENALRCAKTYIDVDNLAIIVVGDREKVENGIRELGLGPLTVWSIEDVLGPPPSMQ